MHVIGYWIRSLFDDKYFPPQELVGELPSETREHVAAYLDEGSLFESYRGVSWCRFGCRNQPMGSRELTDGQWVWPEGLSHYVRDHGVTLPDEFIRHVLSGGSRAQADAPDKIASDELWLQWCSARSSRHLQTALAAALVRANARAQELRQANWKRREASVGLSDAKCMHKGCSSKALAGMAICAMHASNLSGYDPGGMAYFEGLRKVLNAKNLRRGEILCQRESLPSRRKLAAYKIGMAVSESTMVRRPGLVWFTQVLLVIGGVLAAVGGVWDVRLASQSARGGLAMSIMRALLVRLPVVGAELVLFYGLLRRHRWAWLGSVLFATLTFLLVILSVMYPSSGPIPQIEVAPSEQIGARIGQALLLILMALYPVRIFLSPAVRAFFRVGQGATEGR